MPFISRQILGPVLFILLFLLIVLRIFLPDTNRNYTYDPMERLMQEQRMFLDPSLPHAEYKRKEDSIRRRILEENSFHNSRGDSWSIISFGPSVFEYQIGNSKEYFFSMAGYYLKNDSYFFRKEGRNYVSEYIEDNRDGGFSSGHYKISPERVRYISLGKEDGAVLIPTTETLNTIITVIIWALAALLIILMLNNFFVRPLNLLARISKGEVFDERNINSLFSIAWLLLFFGLGNILIRIILHVSFKSMLPDYIGFSYFDAFKTGLGCIMESMVVFLIALAFSRGRELEMEQELTV